MLVSQLRMHRGALDTKVHTHDTRFVSGFAYTPIIYFALHWWLGAALHTTQHELFVEYHRLLFHDAASRVFAQSLPPSHDDICCCLLVCYIPIRRRYLIGRQVHVCGDFPIGLGRPLRARRACCLHPHPHLSPAPRYSEPTFNNRKRPFHLSTDAGLFIWDVVTPEMASNPDRNANTPQSTRDGLHPSFKRSYDQADYEDDNHSAHSSSSSSASSSSTPSVPSCKRMRTSERNYAPTNPLRSPSLESMRHPQDAQALASGSTPREQPAATSSRLSSPPPGNADDLPPALTLITSAQASSVSTSAPASETPHAGNASDATSTTASSSSPGDNFRLSMERYTAFDSNISALRDNEVPAAAPAQVPTTSAPEVLASSQPIRT